jgi:macrodomain Ter protein organizer (MatP/YcbG family)
MKSNKESYTLRIEPAVRKQLNDLSNKLKMTIGDTIGYLLENRQKNIDYFDYTVLQSKLQKLTEKVERIERQ